MSKQPTQKKQSSIVRLFNELLIFVGLKKKKHHHRHRYNLFRDQVSTTVPRPSDQTPQKKRPRRKTLWPFFNISLFKKKGHHKSEKSEAKAPVQRAHRTRKKPTHFLFGINFTKFFRKKTPSENKYKFAISPPAPPDVHHRHHRKKKAGFRRWFNKYFKTIKEPLYNFLYFLNLRPVPYDPFLDPDRFTHEDTRIMRIQRYMVYAFNSIILYIIAYITAYLIYQLAVIITAAFFDIDSVLYYYEVMFPIGNASPKWTQWNIITITLAGPLVSLMGGILWYKVLMQRAQHPIMKLFWLWLSFHSFNMFFGAFLAGAITNQGFGYVANWLYLGIPLKMFISLILLGIQTYIGWRATRHVLATSNSPQRINRKNRPYFILNQTVLPWFIGSLLMLWIKIPNRTPQHENIIVYDSIILGSMAFLALAPLFNWKAKPFESKFSSSRKKTGFVWAYLLVALLLIILYRLGLERGLHFIIQINISLSLYK